MDLARDQASELFGVTISGSVYHVYTEEAAVIEKIVKAADRPGDSEVGTKLDGGYHAGITNNGMVQYMASYRDGNPVPARYITNSRWGERTTPLVALFLNEAQARKCAEKDNLKPWDVRWIAETRATIAAIRSWYNDRIVLDDNILEGS